MVKFGKGSAFFLLLVSACATARTMPAGFSPIPAEQVAAMIEGKTWFWDGGGAYYGPGGKGVLRFDGKNHEMTWRVADGMYCHKIEKDLCWGVYRKDGKIWGHSLWQKQYPEPYVWDHVLKSGDRLR